MVKVKLGKDFYENFNPLVPTEQNHNIIELFSENELEKQALEVVYEADKVFRGSSYLYFFNTSEEQKGMGQKGEIMVAMILNITDWLGYELLEGKWTFPPGPIDEQIGSPLEHRIKDLEEFLDGLVEGYING